MFSLNLKLKTKFLTISALLFLSLVAPTFAQIQSATQTALDRKRAFELANQNRYLDALPFFEKVAESNPTDAEFWAQYSFAIHSRSLTLDTPEARRRERLAARAIALKAVKLGAGGRVLELVEKIPEDGGGDDFSSNPAVNETLRQAESHFQRAEYDKAFVFFEQAHKLDPKNYQAALYAGDCFYAKKEYAKAEPWFAKAVAIDPNREAAYRFWGDALELQGKTEEARDKFIEAVIAEPFLGSTWDRLRKWSGQSGNGWSPIPVVPPGGKVFGAIEFDEKMLKVEDGTKNWLVYSSTRELWQKQLFKKEFPQISGYRHTLREETAALRAVAEAAKKDLESGKVKTLDRSLNNLIKINEEGLLEAYILFPRINDEIAEDYEEFRQNNRDKLRRFLLEFIVGQPIKKGKVA